MVAVAFGMEQARWSEQQFEPTNETNLATFQKRNELTTSLISLLSLLPFSLLQTKHTIFFLHLL